jgi:hypothetical protein
MGLDHDAEGDDPAMNSSLKKSEFCGIVSSLLVRG